MTLRIAKIYELGSEQAIFDYVLTFLRQQGLQSTRQMDGGCMYRNTECGYPGFKCAIGCLISDMEYVPAFEGKSYNQLVSLGCVEETPFDELLAELQAAHDGNWFQFERNMERIAKAFNLNYKER